MNACEGPGCRLRELGLDFEPGAMPPGSDGQTIVMKALRSYRPDWRALGPKIAFDPQRYVRTRLYADDALEVLLLCWLPGQETPIHDHGGSWGVSVAIAGSLVERSYAAPRSGEKMERTSVTALKPGAVALERGDTIHQVCNASAGPSVSLHVYSPPLTAYGSYDPETGTSTVVRPGDGLVDERHAIA